LNNGSSIDRNKEKFYVHAGQKIRYQSTMPVNDADQMPLQSPVQGV